MLLPRNRRLAFLTGHLRACAQALRMYPPSGPASSREVQQPTKIHGCTIPPSVVVWPMIYVLHNRRENWGDPEARAPRADRSCYSWR
jgi:cytochrome P450